MGAVTYIDDQRQHRTFSFELIEKHGEYWIFACYLKPYMDFEYLWSYKYMIIYKIICFRLQWTASYKVTICIRKSGNHDPKLE